MIKLRSFCLYISRSFNNRYKDVNRYFFSNTFYPGGHLINLFAQNDPLPPIKYFNMFVHFMNKTLIWFSNRKQSKMKSQCNKIFHPCPNRLIQQIIYWDS